jgi:hypothetical protein
MGTGDIVPNGHEQYLPLTLGHYPSYFINEITLINLSNTIKICSFSYKSDLLTKINFFYYSFFEFEVHL